MFVWVCMTPGSILTLSSKRGMIKFSYIIRTLILQWNHLCSRWLYIPLLQCHCICCTQDVWNACVCNIYTLQLSHFINATGTVLYCTVLYRWIICYMIILESQLYTSRFQKLIHMGDSREVPHVNIVRKLRHSCEDVNFASSIYSSTLKQFNFIVDYCLRLHIMYKHSQTHSEHFL